MKSNNECISDDFQVICFQSSTFIHLLSYHFGLMLLFSQPHDAHTFNSSLSHMWLEQQGDPNMTTPDFLKFLEFWFILCYFCWSQSKRCSHCPWKTWIPALDLMSSPLLLSAKERREGAGRQEGRAEREEGKSPSSLDICPEKIAFSFIFSSHLLMDDARMAVSVLFLILSTVN